MTESERELNGYADRLIADYEASSEEYLNSLEQQQSESERSLKEALHSLEESQASLSEYMDEIEMRLQEMEEKSEQQRQQLEEAHRTNQKLKAERDAIQLDYQRLSDNLYEIMNLLEEKLPDLHQAVLQRWKNAL